MRSVRIPASGRTVGLPRIPLRHRTSAFPKERWWRRAAALGDRENLEYGGESPRSPLQLSKMRTYVATSWVEETPFVAE
jgi:hypothetical protein